MLKKISIQNYRNVNIENVELSQVNIFIGPNNSGKSNLIDAMRMSAELVSNTQADSGFLGQLRKRGWHDVLNRKISPPGRVTLRWTMNTGAIQKYEDISYELQFEVGKAEQIPEGFFIASESLGFARPRNGKDKPFTFFERIERTPGQARFSYAVKKTKETKPLYFNVDPKETILRQRDRLLVENKGFHAGLLPMYINVANALEEVFRGFREYNSTYLDMEGLSVPKEIDTSVSILDKRGVEFANVLANFDDKYNFLPVYTNYLRELMPDLDWVKVRMAGDRYRQVDIQIAGQRFNMSNLSDGTKKLMLWTLLLHSPEAPRMMALDEPELNLHVAWLQVLGRWLQSASKTQLFVSTHSPDLLDVFTEKFRRGEVALYVLDPRQTAQVVRLPPERIATQLQQGWKLGDLYRIGEPLVGGWPC